jgi:CRISPR-associated protein Csd1
MLAFELCTDQGVLVHERPKVVEWWRARVQSQSDQGPIGRCLITGKVGPTVRTHPSITGIPQAKTSGAMLISYNSDAFCSWGMEQGANAPVSPFAAEAYARALNELLSRDEGRGRPFRQGIRVSDNSVLVFWSRPADTVAEHEETEDFDAALPDLLDPVRSQHDPNPELFRREVEAIWKRLEPKDTDAHMLFYAMTLGSNSSRVVVRDWFESTAAEVKKNVRWWFDALRVGEQGHERHRWWPPSIRELLDAMRSRPDASEDKGGLSPVLSAKLVRCALRGEPLEAELVRAALARLRLPPSENEPQERRLLAVRVGLIRACLHRPAWTEKREVTVALDPENREVGYVLGRLFCVLESLQRRALGQGLNASIRDKFFASASTTPSLVFGPLLQRAQHHIAKIDKPGADRDLREVMELLPGAALPSVLSLEQQALFALGYYHQLSHTLRQIDEHKASKQHDKEHESGKEDEEG